MYHLWKGEQPWISVISSWKVVQALCLYSHNASIKKHLLQHVMGPINTLVTFILCWACCLAIGSVVHWVGTQVSRDDYKIWMFQRIWLFWSGCTYIICYIRVYILCSYIIGICFEVCSYLVWNCNYRDNSSANVPYICVLPFLGGRGAFFAFIGQYTGVQGYDFWAEMNSLNISQWMWSHQAAALWTDYVHWVGQSSSQPNSNQVQPISSQTERWMSYECAYLTKSVWTPAFFFFLTDVKTKQ